MVVLIFGSSKAAAERYLRSPLHSGEGDIYSGQDRPCCCPYTAVHRGSGWDRVAVLQRTRDGSYRVLHLLLLAFLLTGDDKLVYGQIFYTRQDSAVILR